MIWLAASLYGLGVIGAVAAVQREAPAGTREVIVCILWPLAVAAAIAMSPFMRGRK